MYPKNPTFETAYEPALMKIYATDHFNFCEVQIDLFHAAKNTTTQIRAAHQMTRMYMQYSRVILFIRYLFSKSPARRARGRHLLSIVYTPPSRAPAISTQVDVCTGWNGIFNVSGAHPRCSDLDNVENAPTWSQHANRVRLCPRWGSFFEIVVNI